MIKPEDIPDELIEKLVRPRKSDDWKQQIADDLNVMIEEGVVSPPCYCGRKAFGSVAVGPIIEHEGIPILWAPGANPQNVVTEHWKGQSE